MDRQSYSAERTVHMWTEAEARALVRAQALEQVLAKAEALAQAQAEVAQRRVWRQAIWEKFPQDGPLERAHAPLQAQAQALAGALALARTEAQARTQTQAQEWAQAQVRVQQWVQAQVQAQPVVQTEARTVTYGEVLADPILIVIISSIEPDHHHSLARDVWPSRHKYWWFIQIIVPLTRLPPELLHQILLIIIDDSNNPPVLLMRVSKFWYTIVTGIWASLRLGTTTPKNAITRKLKRNQQLLDVFVDTEIDRGHFTPSQGAYQAIFAAMKATSRWRTLVVETFPAQADLPEDLVNFGLQECSDPVMSRLRTLIIKCTCEMSPLLDRLLRILGKTAGRDLTTITINSAIVISFLVPTYSSIFRSVTMLSLDAPGLPNPVDLLPHLHQLETLTASHLTLPVYPSHVDLPFVHTLRHLTLRAVSIQWMSGRTFYVLESCTILFPLHYHVLHTFNTTFPNCNDLAFQGYPLDILQGVSAHNLTQLSVMSSCSYKPRGNQQLVLFSSQILRESQLAPRILHIGIEAMGWAWTKAFAFMSNLDELVIDSAHPSSLGVKVLQVLVVPSVHANDLDTADTLGGGDTPVCPSLKRLGLRYRRWLRPCERFHLIPMIISIIWSRQRSEFSLQSFRIWNGSEQKGPLELIEGAWISLTGFEHLAKDSAFKGEGLLRLVASRSVETLFKPYQGLDRNASSQRLPEEGAHHRISRRRSF
jgi:hypothetical protein